MTQVAGRDDDVILALANVESSYGPIKAIRGVSLKVRRGEIVTVLGSNGAGKSTILKTISGIIDPSRGTVSFRANITALDPSVIVRMRVSHVPEGRRASLAVGARQPADGRLSRAWTATRSRATSRPCTPTSRS